MFDQSGLENIFIVLCCTISLILRPVKYPYVHKNNLCILPRLIRQSFVLITIFLYNMISTCLLILQYDIHMFAYTTIWYLHVCLYYNMISTCLLILQYDIQIDTYTTMSYPSYLLTCCLLSCFSKISFSVVTCVSRLLKSIISPFNDVNAARCNWKHTKIHTIFRIHLVFYTTWFF